MDNNGHWIASKKTMNHNFIIFLAVGLSVSLLKFHINWLYFCPSQLRYIGEILG